MAGEWMIFEITSYSDNESIIPVRIRMPSLDALQSFTHMVSVDKRPVPIFKIKEEMSISSPQKEWFYFCIYDGMMLCAYAPIESGEVKQEVITDGMAISTPV